MYLLLGSAEDVCCTGVRAALEARGHQVRLTANPLAHPARFTWALSTARSDSRLSWDDAAPLRDADMEGVLVRGPVLLDPQGWDPADLAYTHAEMQATLLAWQWSLPCPVVNRYPPEVWYRPQTPLLSWHTLLWRCGLAAPETIVSNVEAEARAFGERLGGGAICAPLTSAAQFLVATEEEWRGVAAVQRVAPVCLTTPHGAAQLACAVGDDVVWEGTPTAEAAALEPALCRFAAAAGLSFVEIALAPAPERLCVVAVEPFPRLERFGDAARERITRGLAALLTSGRGEPHGGDGTRDAALASAGEPAA